MRYIAHRGNTHGPKPELENTPAYIQLALDAGFYVEVDVWGYEGSLFLGHDSPEHRVTKDFFLSRQWKLFCHCKNLDAINLLHRIDMPTCFVHDRDPYTITSSGFIWCYPGMAPPNRDGIIVMPETFMDIQKVPEYCEKYNVAGICSDYIVNMQSWVEMCPSAREALQRVSEHLQHSEKHK